MLSVLHTFPPMQSSSQRTFPQMKMGADKDCVLTMCKGAISVSMVDYTLLPELCLWPLTCAVL